MHPGHLPPLIRQDFLPHVGQISCLFVTLVCPLIQIPWAKLGREPVVVEIDRLYILAGPKTNVDPQNGSQVRGLSQGGGTRPMVMVSLTRLGGIHTSAAAS